MVESVIQGTGKEIKEIESGRENCMSVSGSCVNGNKNGEEVMNMKSLGLRAHL
jgi:hypothetical protein